MMELSKDVLNWKRNETFGCPRKCLDQDGATQSLRWTGRVKMPTPYSGDNQDSRSIPSKCPGLPRGGVTKSIWLPGWRTGKFSYPTAIPLHSAIFARHSRNGPTGTSTQLTRSMRLPGRSRKHLSSTNTQTGYRCRKREVGKREPTPTRNWQATQ